MMRLNGNSPRALPGDTNNPNHVEDEFLDAEFVEVRQVKPGRDSNWSVMGWMRISLGFVLGVAVFLMACGGFFGDEEMPEGDETSEVAPPAPTKAPAPKSELTNKERIAMLEKDLAATRSEVAENRADIDALNTADEKKDDEVESPVDEDDILSFIRKGQRLTDVLREGEDEGYEDPTEMRAFAPLECNLDLHVSVRCWYETDDGLVVNITYDFLNRSRQYDVDNRLYEDDNAVIRIRVREDGETIFRMVDEGADGFIEEAADSADLEELEEGSHYQKEAHGAYEHYLKMTLARFNVVS